MTRDDEVFTMGADGVDPVNRTDHPAADCFGDWQPLTDHHDY